MSMSSVVKGRALLLLTFAMLSILACALSLKRIVIKEKSQEVGVVSRPGFIVDERGEIPLLKVDPHSLRKDRGVTKGEPFFVCNQRANTFTIAILRKSHLSCSLQLGRYI